jgi:ABC-type Fe3+ transport system substrate-binding protein
MSFRSRGHRNLKVPIMKLSIHRLQAFLSIVVCVLFSVQPSISAESEAVRRLEASAAREGVVTIYGPNADDMGWIPAAFSKVYPRLKVRLFTDLNVVSRLVAENRAGRHEADVVWNSEALLVPLMERDMIVRVDWKSLGVRPEGIGSDSIMAYTNSVTFAVAYDKASAVTVGIPQKWNDLTMKSYRGKMVASPFLMARLCAALAVYEGEKSWTEFAREMRSGASVLWTNDLIEQILTNRERPYAVGVPLHAARSWVANDSRLAYTIPEPVFITQFGSVVLKDAPHPSAARLLASWLASPAGMRAREEAEYTADLRAQSVHPIAIALRDSGKRIHVDSLSAREKRNSLIPTMDRILAGLE